MMDFLLDLWTIILVLGVIHGALSAIAELGPMWKQLLK